MAISNIVQFPTNPNTAQRVAQKKRGRGKARVLKPSQMDVDAMNLRKRIEAFSKYLADRPDYEQAFRLAQIIGVADAMRNNIPHDFAFRTDPFAD